MAVQESLAALVGRVADGALLGLPPDYSFVPMAAVRALIRRGVRDLHLLAVPVGGMACDLLVGAGCVKVLEAAAVSLGEAGPAPRFAEAAETGAVVVRDTTCPAVHTALQAAEKGVPFMPLRGLIGSDVLAHRQDWKVVDDPLAAGGGPIVLVPAIRPDVALLHSPLADAEGNVWIGRRRELVTLVHAAERALVTVERVCERSLLDDEATAAGTIPALYITAIAEAREGAWPVGLPGHYASDRDEIRAYGEQAKTAAGFRDYLESRVFAAARAAS